MCFKVYAFKMFSLNGRNYSPHLAQSLLCSLSPVDQAWVDLLVPAQASSLVVTSFFYTMPSTFSPGWHLLWSIVAQETMTIRHETFSLLHCSLWNLTIHRTVIVTLQYPSEQSSLWILPFKRENLPLSELPHLPYSRNVWIGTEYISRCKDIIKTKQ